MSASILRALSLGILLAGCAASFGCSSSALPSPPGGSPSGPSLTAIPGGSNAATQTDTAWGRIWDALPPSFPLPQGAIPTETRDGPITASFAVGASGEQAADLVQRGLRAAGYSVEALSGPFEDGSFVVDAVGAVPDCRVQVRLTPLSGTTRMAVMFGAGCPFE